MSKAKAKANVFLNPDFFMITTQSIGMLAYPEPDASPYYLSPDVDNATLGHTLHMALRASKRVSVEEFQKIWNSVEIKQLIETRIAWAMNQYGYKTKRAMYKHMDNCSIAVVDGCIEIQPMHHKSLDGYSATTDGPQPLSIPETASDAELGTALREGFKRCTTSVR